MTGSGTMGPPSPLASRFGDQSQLPGGYFSGSAPRPPQPRPFESTIAGRPMPPSGPGSLPAAPLLAGQPFTGSPGMASRFGDQSQLAGGAFSGGAPSPTAGPPIPTSVATQGGFKPAPGFDQALRSVPPPAPAASAGPLPPLSPAAMDARVGAVSPETTLPPSAMDARVGVTTPPAAMSNLQRAPLDITAGMTKPPALGSTNMPFAGIPPSPASVAQRTEILGPLPPDAGTGAPVRSVQQPLIGVPPASGTVPPVGPVPGQDLPAPPAAPGVPPINPPSMIASMPPASVQSVGLDEALALSSVAPPAAIVGRQPAGTPRARGKGQAPAAAAPEAPRPVWTAPKIGMGAGAVVGAKVAGPVGAVLGAGAGWGLGRTIKAMRARGQDVDAQGNILDKAGNIIGHVSDMAGNAFWRRRSMVGDRGSSMSGGGGGGGGWGGIGGWGGGSSYTGGGLWRQCRREYRERCRPEVRPALNVLPKASFLDAAHVSAGNAVVVSNLPLESRIC